MYIKIGKRPTLISPNSIGNKVGDVLSRVGLGTKTCNQVSTWIGKQPILSTVCSMINKSRKQKLAISIDHWDHESPDQTLALILVFLLKSMKKDQNFRASTTRIEKDDLPLYMQPVSYTHLTLPTKRIV